MSKELNHLLIPKVFSARGWKQTEQVSSDLKPTVFWNDDDDSFGDTNFSNGVRNEHQNACTVCNNNQSRYTCPRCHVGYCSLDCYRRHTQTGLTPDASACTEEFYKNRVSSILNLERIESKDNTKQIIQRQHENMAADDQNIPDELYELLFALEEKDGEETLSQEELLSMMSPSLRASFQRDLQSGDIHNLILKPWHPWWRRELLCDGNPTRIDSSLPNETLDERLLQTPPFSTLRKGKPPLLLYNLIDVLYGFCLTLRLYHGVTNASYLPVDACATLVSNSSVLQKDDRYSSLEEVLSVCTQASALGYTTRCNTEWTVLLEDCALMVVSHRLVGRALLEALDLLKSGIKQLKKLDREMSNTGKGTIKQFRLARKKIEFFVSWSQETNDFGVELKENILGWMETWTHSDNLEDNLLGPLKLPEDNLIKRSSPLVHVEVGSSPLMVEIETKQRKS